MWKGIRRIRRRWRRFNRKAEIFFVFLLILYTVLYFNLRTPEKEAAPKEYLRIDGEKIPVLPNAVTGYLDYMTVRDTIHIEFSGWAFNGLNSRLPEAILITYAGKKIFSGQTVYSRPDLLQAFGDNALKSGFKFVLPLKLFKDKELNRSKLRLFALSKDVASELHYPAGFK